MGSFFLKSSEDESCFSNLRIKDQLLLYVPHESSAGNRNCRNSDLVLLNVLVRCRLHSDQGINRFGKVSTPLRESIVS